MSFLDFRLRYLIHRFDLITDPLHLLVQYRGEIEALQQAGFRLTCRAGDVAAGFVAPEKINEFLALPEVIVAEASGPYEEELDLSKPAMHITDAESGKPLIPSSGKNVIIGVIDSAFDLGHPSLRGPDGQTRIISAWDQRDLVGKTVTAPTSFGYGAEYSRENIQAAIDAKTRLVINDGIARDSHGTNVAGVAAGLGDKNGKNVGIAPEAELICVCFRNSSPAGTSAYVLDAIRYILDVAHREQKPVVINFSQGDNLGAHDGTSLLERAIDHLALNDRLIMVKSAGNETEFDHHADGRVSQGEALPLIFELGAGNDIGGDQLEIWYETDDRIAVQLQTPSGWTSPVIIPDTDKVIEFPGGGHAFVSSELDYPTNHDNRIGIVFETGGVWEMGEWVLLLHGNRITDGHFHAWADRHLGATSIKFSGPSKTCTITLPGTARQIITVGGYVTYLLDSEVEVPGWVKVGQLEPGSSIGPTRDGRVKPNVTAPGFRVMAPCLGKEDGSDPFNFQLQTGTSIAAPHVTGAIALLLSFRPDLTAQEVRKILEQAADEDAFTDVTPNFRWGGGKLNAKAAYEAVLTNFEKENNHARAF